jgi:anti-sigma regulatory factor (Ser/Thr protein kinase)
MEKRVLIARWMGSPNPPIAIYDEASVSFARQRVREAGQHAALNAELIETVALIASELTHNHLSHAKQGYFDVQVVERHGVKGLEVIAADLGPGIERPGQAIHGPERIHGTLGAGLSAVCRMADEVEFDNRLLEGVCIVARKFETRSMPLCCEAAIMGRPFPGEVISGDDGIFLQSESGFLAGVSDGLGHGPVARTASNRAIDALRRHRQMDLDQLVNVINDELEGTRGCAMSIARFNRGDRMLESASLGDVHAHLYHLREALFLASTPMILGGTRVSVQKIRIERTRVEPGSVLVMFTDGLKSRTSLKGQLDVLRQPPIAIAQHLLENDSRPDDDALVLTARFLK